MKCDTAIISALLITAASPAAIANTDFIYKPALDVVSEHPSWSIGIHMGPYWPGLQSGQDTSSGLQNHFKTQFSSGRAEALFPVDGPLLKSLEVEYYLPHDLLHPLAGRIGFEFGVGHWSVNGKARLCFTDSTQTTPSVDCDTQGSTDTATSGEGNTSTSLTILPLSASLVYRADQLLERYNLPLMPYVKAGVSYSFWWAHAGGEIASQSIDTNDEGIQGEGGTLGYQFTAGLALNLNWLSSSPHTKGGLQMLGSHLFFEASLLQVDQFGSAYNSTTESYNHLQLNDVVYSLGLNFDFE